MLSFFILLPLLSAQAAVDIPDQSLVRIQGQALSRPGQFGKQFFYLYHQGEVVQIYNYWQRFPEISLGDYLEIRGVFSRLSNGPRIKTKEISDISTINKSEGKTDYQPETIESLTDLEKQSKISLAKIRGSVSQIKGNIIKLKNDFHEFTVDMQNLPQFSSNSLANSSQLSISGLLFKKSESLRIYPLKTDDIRILSAPSGAATNTPLINTEKSDNLDKKTILKYLGLILTCLLIFTIIRKP